MEMNRRLFWDWCQLIGYCIITLGFIVFAFIDLIRHNYSWNFGLWSDIIWIAISLSLLWPKFSHLKRIYKHLKTIQMDSNKTTIRKSNDSK